MESAPPFTNLNKLISQRALQCLNSQRSKYFRHFYPYQEVGFNLLSKDRDSVFTESILMH